MADLNSEIIRKVIEHDYKDEVTEMSEKLRKKIVKLGPHKILNLQPEIDGEVLGKDNDEIINKFADRLIKYKIIEKGFERMMSEGLIKPINMCSDSCSITKNFKRTDGTSIMGKFGFRRIIYDKFKTV